MGRLGVEKAPLLLLQSFSLVLKQLPEVHLYILGDGNLRLPMEEYLEQNNLKKHVHLLGFHTNPYKFLAKEIY